MISLLANLVFLTWIFFRHYETFKKIFWLPWYFITECMLMNSKGSPVLHFSALCDISRKKYIYFSEKCFFCLQLGKEWFPSHIENERHPLGVSKLFCPGHISKPLRFRSLRYSAHFRRFRLVITLYRMWFKKFALCENRTHGHFS